MTLEEFLYRIKDISDRVCWFAGVEYVNISVKTCMIKNEYVIFEFSQFDTLYNGGVYAKYIRYCIKDMICENERYFKDIEEFLDALDNGEVLILKDI